MPITLLAMKYWKAILAGVALTGLAIALMLAQSDARHWRKKAEQTQVAYDTTVSNYRLAAAETARKDAQNVARIQTEQQAITERTEHEYQTRLADSASRYDRLRATAQAYSRSSAGPVVSDTREATCVAYAGTGCEAIPATLKAAQDNTDQLVALQAWVGQQAAVDVGSEVKP